MDVIVFNKTKAERLQEFQDIFSSTSPLAATAVASHWSFLLELTLEPVGWQAVWKIPRHKCNMYNLKFPTVVLVEVTSVDFKELAAWVTILKVQDTVDIPTSHEVDLKNLHPTHHQENAVDAYGTANTLDQLRFFYNHLWHPWDCDDDAGKDWPSTYLEARLQLYYDMRQGHLCRESAERISKLINEGREIYSEIKELETEFDEGLEEEDVIGDVPLTDSVNAALALSQLHIRLEPIKTELRILENSAMRALFGKVAKGEKHEPEKYVVWNGHSLEKWIDFLKAFEKLSGPATVAKPVHSLQAGLDMAHAGDTFVLSSGTHYVNGSSRLEEGGSIIGMDEELSACLQPPKASNFFLDVCTGTLLVQNVQVNPDKVDIAFLVRPKGTLELTNVQLNSTKCSVGVVVLPGGRLSLKQCKLEGFQIGVYCHPGGSIVLSNSEIKSCSVGIQVQAFGSTSVKVQNSVLSNCRHAAIDVVDLNMTATGHVDILKDLAGFSFSNVEIKSCQADVVVQQHRSIFEGDEPGCSL